MAGDLGGVMATEPAELRRVEPRSLYDRLELLARTSAIVVSYFQT